MGVRKYLTISIVAAFLVMALPTVAAQDDPYDPVVGELEPYCAAARAALHKGEAVDEQPQYEPTPEEIDPLDDHPECRQLRDEAEQTVWDVYEPPPTYYCKNHQGNRICVYFHHELCDLGFYNSYFRVCIGGIFPGN